MGYLDGARKVLLAIPSLALLKIEEEMILSAQNSGIFYICLKTKAACGRNQSVNVS